MASIVTALVAPYGVCFVLVLTFSLLYMAAEPDTCTDGEIRCGFGDAFFLLLTTLHAGSWGHIHPYTTGQQAIACLVSAIGYLWPLASIMVSLFQMGQKALLKIAACALSVSYCGLALLGNLVFAGLLGVAAGVSSENDFGSNFYFAWMTFHMRAYGEYTPESTGTEVISTFIVMAGNLCWVAPLLVAARQSVLDPGSKLFAFGTDGSFQGLFAKAVYSVVIPYAVCVTILLVLSALYLVDQGDCEEKCGYGNALFLLLTTFHGASWGHVTPRSTSHRALACLTASIGYLWRQVALVFLFVSIDQKGLARRYGLFLLVSYVGMLLGSLALAGINLASYEANKSEMEPLNFGTSFYYIWMTYHGRAYGEISPSGVGQDIVAVGTSMAGNLGWVWPLLAAFRASLLHTVIASVRPSPGPETIGVTA